MTSCTSNQEQHSILQIFNALFSSFSSEQKKDFLYWKNFTANGEVVSNEGIQKILKQVTNFPLDERKRNWKKAKKSRAMTM
eukprot:6750299-Ditylum_brightwellii.AAC.1